MFDGYLDAVRKIQDNQPKGGIIAIEKRESLAACIDGGRRERVLVFLLKP